MVILSERFRRSHFGGDNTIVGRQVKLDDYSYTVIGVMPAAFENVLAPSAEIWSPLQYDAGNIVSTETREWGHHLRMVGRLRAGVTLAQAKADLDSLARSRTPEFPRPSWAALDHGFIVSSLQEDLASGVKPALLAVIAAAVVVLLIACVNVTNLLLAQGAQRRGELALRAAIGAARSRLIRQLVTESLLLAALGGAFGMLMAQAGVRILVAMSPPGLPRVNAMAVNGAVFAFAFATALVVGLIVGLVPAVQTSGNELNTALQQSSCRAVVSHRATRHALVIGEVTLAVALLVSSGLLLHSLKKLLAVDPGFDASHVLTMQVHVSGGNFNKDDASRDRFFVQALGAVQRVPGVATAALTSQLPLSGDFESYGVQLAASPTDATVAALRYSVSPSYFQAMHIPLLRGRLLDEHDVVGAPQAVVISESFAKRILSGKDPIGQRIRVGPDVGKSDRPWGTIVGVVGDVKQASLALADSDAFYTTAAQFAWVDNVQSIVVRTRGDAAALAPAIRNAIWSVDKDQPIVRVATMESLLARSEAERHFVVLLFEAFSLVALALAATGIYAVLSGSVAERTREIGVRSALGATRGSILIMMVRQGMVLTALGVLLGLACAAVASQVLSAMLFGISQLDPITYLGVIALLAAVAAIACFIPARRAAKVDPMVALRYE